MSVSVENGVMDTLLPPAPAQTRPAERTGDREPKQQPPHAVVLHNDERNGMDHVVLVLHKVFGYGEAKAVTLMLEAHTTGRAVIWSGMKEHAELKAEQVQSCGPDPLMADQGAGRLRVTVEELPG